MSVASWSRFGAIAGILFAVLFTIGVILPDLPSGGESAAVVDEFYADSGNRMIVIVASYLIVLAGLAFLGFLSEIYRGLRRAEGDSGSLATMALAAGVLFTGMLYASSSAWGNVPGGVELGGEEQPNSEIAIWFTQLGYGDLLLYGMFAAIAVIVPTSVLVLRTGVLPRWQAWTGFACAFLLLFGVMFLPMIALPIWAIATSVAMLKSPATRTAHNAQPSPRAA
ncbi:hypothetical protein BH23CHL2_BH23CHL2_06850 [soil metagenome]